MDALGDIYRIHQLIGYCPKFDALLDLTTLREHMGPYAPTEGIVGDAMRKVVEERLKAVGFKKFENSRACQPSGGDKRKLSFVEGFYNVTLTPAL